MRESATAQSTAKSKWLSVTVREASDVVVHAGSEFKRGLGFTLLLGGASPA